VIDWTNRVQTNVKNVVSEDYETCFFSSTSEDVPPSFPCVYIEQLDNSVRDTDLELNEHSVLSEIEIKTYSAESLAEAKDIAKIASETMRTMGYQRAYGIRALKNVTNTSIYQTIARYRRLICSGDEIETI